MTVQINRVQDDKLPAESILDTAAVFDSFAALTSIAPEAGGLLVFYGELDATGMANAVAANIAGAASLGVDANAARVKQALRQGVCDFMVNTLDEALRILKNEIRKKQPVAVALVGDPGAVVAEMIERGVQPDLVAQRGSETKTFIERGAMVLPVAETAANSVAVTWSVDQNAATWLPRVDALAMEAIADAADPRVKWLRLAPRYLRQNLMRERFVRMRSEQVARFRERLLLAGIPVPVTLASEGETIRYPAASSAAV